MEKSNKILFVPIIFFYFALLIVGGKESKDINEKAIVTAVAIDKKNDEIYLYAEIANIRAKSDMEGGVSLTNKYIYVTSHGKTIVEARDNLERKMRSQIYISAVRVVILTENFAKEHLVEYLYRIRSEELYRKKVLTVITKDNPEDLFENSNSKDVSVGFSIDDTMENLRSMGGAFEKSLMTILEYLSSQYSGFLMPTIGLVDNENSLIGYSVVNGTTTTDFIPAEDSKSIVFLKAPKPRFFYVLSHEDNNLSIEVELNKRIIKSAYKDDNIYFDIKLDFEADIFYGDKPTPYDFDKKDTEELTEMLTKKLRTEFVDAIEKAQNDYKCDYFSFNEEFRIKYPEKYEKMDWGEEFQKANFNVEVKVDLSETWMMDYSTKEKK